MGTGSSPSARYRNFLCASGMPYPGYSMNVVTLWGIHVSLVSHCDSSVYMYLYGRLVFKIFFNYVVLKSSRHINSVNQLVFTWIDGVTTLSFVYRYRVYLPVQSISLIVYYTQKKLTINQSLCVGFCGSEGMLTSIGDTVVHFYFNYRWNIQFREALMFFWKMKTYWKCKYYERQNPKMFLLPIMKVYHSLQWY